MTDKAYAVQNWLNRGYKLSLVLRVKQNHLLSKDAGNRSEVISQKQKPDGNREEIKECEKSFLRSEIEKMEKELAQIDYETDRCLRELPDGKQYSVLYSRFVRRISWDQIAAEQDMSKSYCYQIKRDGIEYLARRWKG